MFHLTILASGSAGNCALIESAECRLLVDAGLSARQIVSRLHQCGLELTDLDGVLITHEHSDHAAGLEILCKQNPELPIYCTSTTGEALHYQYGSRGKYLTAHRNWQYFRADSQFVINDCEIEAFAVPHDAVEPIGFVMQNGMGSLGFLTDLGHVTKSVLNRIKDVHTLLIESNHDSNLLAADTKRPWSLKQRIMGRHGHLSNTAAAEVVRETLYAGNGQLKRTVLGHLSRDCNTPDLALKAMQEEMEKLTAQRSGPENLQFFCASQSEISEAFQIGDVPVVTSLNLTAATQLDLFPSLLQT